MLKRTDQRLSRIILIVAMFLFWVLLDTKVLNPYVSAQVESFPREKHEVVLAFEEFITKRFSDSVFVNEMNFSGTVSIVAVPAKKLVSVEDIQKGALVGALFLSTGSLKYDLSPGSYGVYVKRKGPSWIAQIINSNGKIIKEVPAKFSPGKEVDRVMATVDFSVCYHINGGIVCI